jgi:hypothetical protein
MSNDEGIAIPSPWKAELGDADAVVAGVSRANMERLQPTRLPLQKMFHRALINAKPTGEAAEWDDPSAWEWVWAWK